MNGADAASRGGFRDAKDAAELLQRITETYQRRHLSRQNEAGRALFGSIQCRVRAHLDRKVSRLEEEALVTVKFQDSPANTRGFVVVGHANRPFILGRYNDAKCSCGAKEVDQEPCACLLKAAKASGFDITSMLHERDGILNFKYQYTDLPEFTLPSTEDLDACPADKFLVAASSYPIPRGRPSKRRFKGAIDQWKKKKKRARTV